MLPFRVFDKKNKVTWVILNFQPSKDGGVYLAAREDDTNRDGEISLIPAEELCKFKLVDFLENRET